MASIRKLPSGKFNARIVRHGSCISKTFLLKPDALKWARQKEVEIEQQGFNCKNPLTFGEALTRYRTEVSIHKKSIRTESQLIAKWQEHPLAQRRLADIKPSDFATYRDTRLATVTGNTVRLELAIVSHLYTIAAKEWGISTDNPISSIRKPKPANARTRRLEGDESVRLIEACKTSKNPLLLPLVTLALETGMRLGEMLSLTWDEVDYQASTITKSTTKNGEARTIPLTRKALAAIQSVPRAIHTDRVFYVWKNHPDAIKSSWTAALKRAGIQN